jgi:ATP-dependent DNA ligase
MNTTPIKQLPLLKVESFKASRIKYPVILQPKLDGINARYYNGKFYTTDHKIWHDNVVLPYVRELQGQFPNDVLVHGEFWSPELTLQQIVSGISVVKSSRNELSKKIKFWMYDWQYYGNNRVNEEYQIRYNTLWNLLLNKVPQFDWLDYVQAKPGLNDIEVREYFASYVEANSITAMNMDGIIIRSSCPSRRVFKKKFTQDSEFLCIGVGEGKGKHRGRLGYAVCVVVDKDGKRGEEFHVGTGFSDLDRDLYFGNSNLLIGKQLTIAYQSLTRKGIPFHLVFKGVRDYE